MRPKEPNASELDEAAKIHRIISEFEKKYSKQNFSVKYVTDTGTFPNHYPKLWGAIQELEASLYEFSPQFIEFPAKAWNLSHKLKAYA